MRRFALIALLLIAPLVLAAPYYNSSESGCDGTDSTVLFCDDFEDGDWAQTNSDDADQSQNDGWGLNINKTWPDPSGTGYGRCGGKGAGGTDCAATSGLQLACGTGYHYDLSVGCRDDSTHTITQATAGIMGKHYFAPSDTTYTEVYFRWYQKQLPGFGMGHEKVLYVGSTGAQGWFAIMNKYFGNGTLSTNPQQTGGWMSQNQGNTLTIQNGNWYYIEVRFKLETWGQADGIYELWMDDCGANGLGCTGPGTLRASWTGQTFMAVSGEKIKFMWIENWGNAGSDGEEYYDQFYVATRRIGPMSLSTGVFLGVQ